MPNVVAFTIGKKPTFMLHTYIDRQTGTPKPQSRNILSLLLQYVWTKGSSILVIEKVNFDLNISIGKVPCLKKNLNAPRPSEHPPVGGKKCQNVY